MRIFLTLPRNGKKIAIQCKRHSRSITNRAVQEVYAAKAYYNCSEAYVITNSEFTIPAKNLAKKLGVTLFNRHRLFTLIQKANKNLKFTQ
ncbi:restriction endonuclease [Fictibacillus phosphorivorans]|uniref:restriction endonuclease n=1 Tax=Fictibacillus phosphorivorans TaxID=1221500 RepID=UPI0009ED3F9A